MGGCLETLKRMAEAERESVGKYRAMTFVKSEALELVGLKAYKRAIHITVLGIDIEHWIYPSINR